MLAGVKRRADGRCVRRARCQALSGMLARRDLVDGAPVMLRRVVL